MSETPLRRRVFAGGAYTDGEAVDLELPDPRPEPDFEPAEPWARDDERPGQWR